MTNIVPIPAPIPMPPPFVVPDSELALPSFKPPEWEPVPIYRDDVPALNPKPAPEEKKPEDSPKEGATPSMPEVPAPDLPPLPQIPTQETINTIELPGGFEVPVPPKEILVTAVSTAGAASVVSVGATMAATNLFKRVVSIAKPVIKVVLKKIAKLTGKKPPLTWARQRQSELRQHIRDRKHSRGGS
jgi:hypothetical protein